MKGISLFFFLTIGTVSVVSAESSVLSLVKKKYSGAVTFQAKFEQSIYWNVREKTSRLRGTITVAPRNRFRIETENETYVGDGKTLLQYNRSLNQLIIRDFEDLSPSMYPSRLLSTYLTDYSFKEKERKNGTVTLIWNGDSSSVSRDYRTITVDVRESDGMVLSLVLTDRENNVHTYRFKKIDFGISPSPEFFTFNPPSDATIIDKRR